MKNLASALTNLIMCTIFVGVASANPATGSANLDKLISLSAEIATLQAQIDQRTEEAGSAGVKMVVSSALAVSMSMALGGRWKVLLSRGVTLVPLSYAFYNLYIFVTSPEDLQILREALTRKQTALKQAIELAKAAEALN